MICIVDYGMGNLRSVQKGFEQVGHAATISARDDDLLAADRLVLPGVGAFGDAMIELRQRELIEPLKEFIASGRPVLGICLGLQLLFDVGHEAGRHTGLGIVPGEVVRFEVPVGYKVPHMGWNQLSIRRCVPLLAGIEPGAYVYFVHSYHAVPTEADVIVATTDYPQPFVSVIVRDRLVATQFHPEKSQAVGLRMLKNFAELV